MSACQCGDREHDWNCPLGEKDRAKERARETARAQRKYRATIAQLRKENSELREALVPFLGCADNSCRFVKRGGMGTNGGCRCFGRRPLMDPRFQEELSAAMTNALAVLRSHTKRGDEP